MTNPTSNFNWQMPTASDLVTDLPADFETFGQAVDTSLADLKGGTTGQVLSKASNTDMDFTWVAQDDSNAIQNAIVDAKGDLIAASAADTPARLAVGNNGETLVADSSTATGLRYQPAPSINYVINGGFDIWQRGTSIAATASATYCADRFQLLRGGGALGATVTRQASGNTSFEYAARVQRDSGNTSTAVVYLGNSIESSQSIPLAGQTVVFSFWARKGANYSQASSNVEATLASGTGTNQNIFSALTGQSTVVTSAPTLTTSWQRFSMTGTVSSSATQLAFYFAYTPVGTAGANDYFEVSGVKLELGSVPTAFSRAGGTIQGELAACQRYYQYYAGGTGLSNNGVAGSASTLMLFIQTQGPMRTSASITLGGTLYVDDGYSGASNAASPTVDFVDQYQGGGRLRIAGFSGMTTGRQYAFYYNTGYVALSAEL